MIKSESISKVALALLSAQKEMGDAKKGASNPFFKSKYADLNSIREAVLPALNQNGISVLQLCATSEAGKPVVRTLLLHESGEYLGSETEVVVAKQNDPQAYGSAMSYARRYGLQAAVCVGAEDDDGEKAMGRTKPAPLAAPMAQETKQAEVSSVVQPAQPEQEEIVKPAPFVRSRPQKNI